MIACRAKSAIVAFLRLCMVDSRSGDSLQREQRVERSSVISQRFQVRFLTVGSLTVRLLA